MLGIASKTRQPGLRRPFLPTSRCYPNVHTAKVTTADSSQADLRKVGFVTFVWVFGVLA